LRACDGAASLQFVVFATGAAGLNLIFDADDTLWESNIHFLETEAAFIELLERAGVTEADAIRLALRRHELKIIAETGYGRAPYVAALRGVMAEMAPAGHHEPLSNAIERIGAELLSRHCKLLPGVAETLAILAQRHRLLLFTKGQPAEQLRKLERSGLRHHFARIGVPREKDPANYHLLIAQARLDPSRTVMIGNSPRSDINPALAAGLHAVYIPYPHTWEQEHAEIDYGCDRMRIVTTFPQLLEVF
jgi:putative hydrolase of the HAD superfamily